LESKRTDPEQHWHSQLRQLAFLALLLIYFLVLLFSMSDLSWEGRLFPLITLAGIGVLWLLKLLATLAPRLRPFIEPDAGLFRRPAHLAAAARPASGLRGARQQVRPLLAWGWVAGTLLGMYLTGFLIGTALAVLVYLRLIARETWLATLITTAVTTGFAYFVFDRLMHVSLGWGLLPLG
jgi:Tripartite tricarboxylate transporter TctB family